jgi:outer membrane protein
MNRSLVAFACMGFLCLVSPAHADTLLGVYAGTGVWQQSYSGGVRSGITDVDIEDDLGVEDEQNDLFYAAIEHPLPVVPNLRLEHAIVEVSAATTLERSIDFNGVIFPVGLEVGTDVDLTQSDAVLYYELLDNALSLDVGMAGRYVDARVALTSSTQNSEAEFSGVVPLLYTRARVDLPFGGMWFGAAAQGLGYDGNHLIDANAQVGWESRYGLGFEMGWRHYDLEIADVDDIDHAEIEIKGPYAAFNFHF